MKYAGGPMVDAGRLARILAPVIAKEGLDLLLLRAGSYNGPTRTMIRTGVGRFTIDKADRLLLAAGLEGHLREVVDDEPAPPLACADCGKRIEPGDYRPLTLWRPVPDAPPAKRAKAGGRRARQYDLCRRCAGEALRQRARNGSTSEKGVKRALRRSERVPPRPSGRPRLFSDDELRQLHVIYDQGGLSVGDLARQLAGAGRGSFGGISYALSAGWKRLCLPTRNRSDALALANHRRGRIPYRTVTCPARKRNGQPCTAPVKRSERYCVSHLRFGWDDEA